MKIVSKFQDYYDSALAFGHDEHIIYVRTPALEETRGLWGRTSISDAPLPRCVQALSIFFCGKVYPAYYLDLQESPVSSMSLLGQPQERVFPTAKSLLKSDSWGLHREATIRSRGVGRRAKWKRGGRLIRKPVDLEANRRRLSQTEKDILRHEEIFLEINNQSMRFASANPWQDLKSPVFIEATGRVLKYGSAIQFKGLIQNIQHDLRVLNYETYRLINPCLRLLDFQKRIDAFTAYQEIEMFMGGVLGFPEAPVVEISNDDMRDKKGFDKHSFRNPVSNRKIQRRANRARKRSQQ